MERILIIGANGQIGSELVGALAEQHGADNVIASDIGTSNVYKAARYTQLDVLDRTRLAQLVADEGITQVYQLAALLDVIAGRAAPLTGGADAIGNMRVIDAIYAKAGFER